MLYVTIPEPIALVNPDTDELLSVPPTSADVPATVAKASFADYVRALRKDERFIKGVDMCEAYESTASLIKAKPGDVVPLQDETGRVLQACAKRPTTISPVLIYSPEGERFVKALTEASTKATEPEKAKT